MDIQKDYSWQIKRALTVPILIGGTEKKLVILNTFFCLIFILASHMSIAALFTFPAGLLFHGICMHISKRDPRMLEIFARSTRYKGYYHAVPKQYQETFVDRLFPKGYRFNSLPQELRGYLK